jgi:cytochrome c-type biogenesis protein CcmF
MENIGALSVLLAFCFAIYAILASVIGKLTKRPFLTLSAERAVYSIWVLITIAAGILIYSLMTGDFRMAYVAHYTNRAMPTVYKYTAWWGGQEGSLLFWNWLLASYGAVVVFKNRNKFRQMMPYVVAVMMATQVFFLTLILFIESPFRVLMAGKRVIDVGDGQGLSALLQYWTMIIHPPMLYLGYVGFVVPFSFAMASLITRQPGEQWIQVTRRWTLVTWMFQTTGVLLGAGWAYAVLGWGGYWGWDPVENASLLPWITATAFSNDAGEKRNDEGMEHGAGLRHLLPMHLRDVPDAQRDRQFGPCVRQRADRDVLRGVPGDWNLGYGDADPEPARFSEERGADGERVVARIQLPF